MSADPIPPRWYVVDRDGLATLCRDEADAVQVAAECNRLYPRNAPHRAVLLAVAGKWVNVEVKAAGRRPVAP